MNTAENIDTKSVRDVAAGLIMCAGKLLIGQRKHGKRLEYKWEFPGGKMEPGETPEEALVREIREELSTEISVDEFLCTVEYDYPKFHLTMHCYLCSLLTEALHLNEHEAARWLTPAALDTVRWLPADESIIEKLKLHPEGELNTLKNKDNTVKKIEN